MVLSLGICMVHGLWKKGKKGHNKSFKSETDSSNQESYST